jgi:hypothetical protein
MFCDEWLKIDALLQEKLKRLRNLDQERELLIAEAEQQGEITPLLKQKMNLSLEKYEKLASEVAKLKKQAKALKTTNNQGK